MGAAWEATPASLLVGAMTMDSLSKPALSAVDAVSRVDALSSFFCCWASSTILIGDSANMSSSSNNLDKSLDIPSQKSIIGSTLLPSSLAGRLPERRLEALDLLDDSSFALMRKRLSSSSCAAMALRATMASASANLALLAFTAASRIIS